jgi:hypothetical protein
MKTTRTQLRVERLDQRDVPSATISTPVTNPSTSAAAAYSPFAVASGAYTTGGLMVDAGPAYRLHGTGHYGSIGAFTVTGSVQAVGFVASGRAGGTLTLASASGTLTIELTGPVQAGFSPLPRQFTYRVVHNTGGIARIPFQGTLTLDLGAPHALPGGRLGTYGSFDVTFS